MTSRYRCSLGALCLLQIMAGAAIAAPTFVLPPLVQPASTEHHPGKVIWADLVTPDVAAAKHFYGELFGWTFNDVHTGASDYSVALLDGNPVGGLFQRGMRPGEQRQPAWLTFISVADVAAAGRNIVAHGGKMLAPIRSYPDRGRQAVFADPQGAVFAVLQSSSGDPEDVLAAPGEWIWSSVLARDPDTDAAFYQNVFGYEVFEIPGDDGSKNLLLSTDDYARVSLNALPADAAKRHPHWLNFVRVTSATDTAARAEALGGRVLVKPFTDRHGGLVAVVADPAGAPFGLLEWTDTDSKQGAK
jgi:uncharacterized protein